MGTQLDMFDLRSDTRPLREVVAVSFTSETKSRLLLSCGHSLENVHYDEADAKRKRCSKCAAFGDDEDGLKYKVPK